jgi:hypothetical protein
MPISPDRGIVGIREEMGDFVWSIQMRLLTKRFGISDVDLRKRA